MDKMLGATKLYRFDYWMDVSFQKLLSKESDAQYRSEQGKNFNDFVEAKSWGVLPRPIMLLVTGLANNTLTSMVKKLEEQGLVTIQSAHRIKGKYISDRPRLGAKKSVTALVKSWVKFLPRIQIKKLRIWAYQQRIISNLKVLKKMICRKGKQQLWLE